VKGYVGIVTSMMAELTNETNAARGFSMLPMSFSLGYTIGFVAPSDSPPRFHAEISGLSPFIGGMLSRPQDRWPGVFSHPFWAEYPYFLPCFAVAVCGCASLIANAIYLKEVCSLSSLFRDTRYIEIRQ
jgi:hypothetical protein